MTHHVGPNLLLTSKQKFHFSMRLFVLVSTGGLDQRDVSPCVIHHMCESIEFTLLCLVEIDLLYLGFEGVGIPVQTLLDLLLALLLVLQVVETVVAVAVEAKLSVGEAIAVQLQALRLGAVARLSRPHARRLERGRVGTLADGGRVPVGARPTGAPEVLPGTTTVVLRLVEERLVRDVHLVGGGG